MRTPKQQGFSLIGAIFVIVVLSALAVTVSVITSDQTAASANHLRGSRAYRAAEGGMQWGIYQALRNDSCLASRSFTLGGHTVTVRCISDTHFDPSAITAYRISAEAQAGSLASAEQAFVRRVVRATVIE